MRGTWFSGCAVVLAAALSGVQASTLPAQSIGLHPWFSGGVDLELYDGPTPNVGVLVIAGVELRRPGSNFSGRFGASYFRRTRNVDQSALLCDGCRQAYRFDLPGVMLEGRYDLTGGGVRPYVASGLGIYRAATTRSFNYTCPPFDPAEPSQCIYDPGASSSSRSHEFSVGLHAGIGVSIPVGASRMSAELRYYGFALAPDQEEWLLPLVIGFEF